MLRRHRVPQLAVQFRQKHQFYADTTFTLVANVVLVVLAVMHFGPLALAWSRVAGQLASMFVLFCLVDERFLPGFDRRHARHLLHLGLPLAGANVVGYATTNLDFVFVGHLKGATRLGYYNLAFNISSWPVTMFGAVLAKVTLPLLGHVRDSRDEVVKHMTMALAALAALVRFRSARSVSAWHIRS